MVYPWFQNEVYRRGISVVPARRLQTWYIRGSRTKVIDVVYPWFQNEGYRRGISVVPERRL